jgi:hypothetical protein
LQEQARSGEIEVPRMAISLAEIMEHLLEESEQSVLVMLSVVPEDIVDKIVQATEPIIGDLYEPDSGVILVIGLEQAIGVTRFKP